MVSQAGSLPYHFTTKSNRCCWELIDDISDLFARQMVGHPICRQMGIVPTFAWSCRRDLQKLWLRGKSSSVPCCCCFRWSSSLQAVLSCQDCAKGVNDYAIRDATRWPQQWAEECGGSSAQRSQCVSHRRYYLCHSIFLHIVFVSVACFGSGPFRTCSLVLGPPGSGKSFVLKRIIQVLKDSEQVLNSSCRKWQSWWEKTHMTAHDIFESFWISPGCYCLCLYWSCRDSRERVHFSQFFGLRSWKRRTVEEGESRQVEKAGELGGGIKKGRGKIHNQQDVQPTFCLCNFRLCSLSRFAVAWEGQMFWFWMR